jgi:hypothetical protein
MPGIPKIPHAFEQSSKVGVCLRKQKLVALCCDVLSVVLSEVEVLVEVSLSK